MLKVQCLAFDSDQCIHSSQPFAHRNIAAVGSEFTLISSVKRYKYIYIYLIRMAQMIKNGLVQTCTVIVFSYSAPHCIKIQCSSAVEQTCSSSVWFYTYIKPKLMTSSLEMLQKLKMKIIIWNFFWFIVHSFFSIILKKKGYVNSYFCTMNEFAYYKQTVPKSACLFLCSCHT